MRRGGGEALLDPGHRPLMLGLQFGEHGLRLEPRFERRVAGQFRLVQALRHRIDLPGMRKEDVKVEVTDGHLAISGERKSEAEEKKENYYRCEREYGSFYRAVPLPEGVKLEDVKASFTDGVLEVSVPMPAKTESKARTVPITEGSKTAKAA